VFKKTIEAVKKAEKAAQEELDALFVPYDEKTGGGGVHWHAAGSAILTNAVRGLAGLREELEKRQGPIDAAQAEADAAAAEAAKSVDATPAALEHAKSLGVDITQIKGTGKDGKVLASDVDAAVAEKEAAHA
jgi:pyruvate/2-oxoglutarate dehydrogenase complex dihydrolipoamide acyltransferase (E2) component